MPTTSGADQDFFTHNNTGTTSNFWTLFRNSSNLFGFDCNANEATAGTVTSGSWHYVVVRAITATNRRISVLNANGSTSHGQNVTSATPTGINVSNIGAIQTSAGAAGFFDGHVAELWVTNADIQGDAAQLLDSTLYKLAYDGPYALSEVAGNLIEYRRLAATLGSDTNRPGEVYTTATWTNTNGVTMGPAPPVSAGYIRPNQFPRLLMC